MTDRELLELAAKASGLVIKRWINAMFADYAVTNRHAEINAWNPLECSADALSLAVDLRLNVSVSDNACSVSWPPHTSWLLEEVKGRPDTHHAATRRAIVRAAAEIGAAMPQETNHD